VSSARVRKQPFITGLVTFIIVYLLEILSVLATITDFRETVAGLLLAFAFHLGAACVVSYGFWGPWNFRRPEEKNWAVLGFVMVLAVPVYGLLGYTGAYAAVHWRRKLDLARHGDVMDAFEQHIAYEPVIESTIKAIPDAILEGDVGETDLQRKARVAPLIDVIKAGDPDLRRGAIFSVSRLSRPTAVKILRESLHDVDPESQFYVAGQLSRIEKELSDHIIKTRRRLELDPDNMELRVQLARYGKEYVESGLLEPTVERYFVTQSIDLAEEVLKTDSRRLDVLLDLGDLRILGNDHAGAVDAYARVVDLDPENTTARVGLAHAYFHLRELSKLGAVISELQKAGDTPKSLAQVIAFWDGAKPNEGARADAAK
jgi:hypothetical protein